MTKSAIYSPTSYRIYSIQAAIARAYAVIRRHITPIILSSHFGLGHAPSPGDKDISIPWLKRTLVAAGTIPSHAKIITAECKGLDGNRGMAGVMTRVHITYTLDSRSNSALVNVKDTQEIHLILKKSDDRWASRLGGIIAGNYREATFYSSTLAKGLPQSILPKVYYAHGSAWLGEYVILMEDIKQRNAGGDAAEKPIDVNFIFGNQIWGLPPSVDAKTLPPKIQTLEQVFITAAGIHAKHWNDARLFNTKWLKTVDWYHGANRTRWEWSVQAGSNAWEKAKAKIGRGELDVKFSEKLIKIMDESFKGASWDVLQKRLHDRSVPYTLSHGDFHAANMILDRSGNSSEYVIYDWSEVCVWEPTTDLGQTIISDVPISVFQTQARPALKKYWEKLIELKAINPTEYTFETCWKHFLRGGVEKWLWVFAILCNFPMPANAIQYFHDQIVAFIELGEKEGGISYDITTVICFAPTEKP